MVSLYGQRRQRTATQLHSLASQMHKDLWQWYQDLPAELVLADHDENKISAPEVFILQLVSLHPAMPCDLSWSKVYLPRPAMVLCG